VIAFFHPVAYSEPSDIEALIEQGRRNGTEVYGHYYAAFEDNDAELLVLSALDWMAKKAAGRLTFVRVWPVPERNRDFETKIETMRAFIRFSVAVYVPNQQEISYGQEAHAA
jgi:hypothetical protein